jgi:Cytochrome c
MKTTTIKIAIGGAVAALCLIAQANPVAVPAADAKIERGKYIVHRMALCIDCHSPRDEKGQFVEGKHLTGATLGFKPTVPMPWMPVAPNLAGLPEGYKREDMIQFLMTGKRPTGAPILPPMPEYRLNREDAEATAAYLESLGKP